MRGRMRLAVGVFWGLAASAPLRAQSATPVRVQVGTRPDTVRVGDPFLFFVRVVVPSGSSIVFPPGPDSTSPVQALESPRIDQRVDPMGVAHTATYRLAAWDIGTQPIPLTDVILRASGAPDRRMPLGRLSVYVRSVLPADSTRRLPKPPRPLFELSASNWWMWAVVVAAAGVVLGVLLWWWRRRSRPRPAVVVDPYARASKEFERIEALGLVESGERGRFVTLAVEVLRDYLAARYTAATLSLTSREVLDALGGEPAVPHGRLMSVLEEADLVKFGRRPVSPDRARELAHEARGVVDYDHGAAAAPNAGVAA